jgi:hypothetical protein
MTQPKSIDEVVVLLNTLHTKTDPSNYFYTTISKYLLDPLKISPILLKEFNNIIRSFNYKKEIRYQIAIDIFSDLLYDKAETLSNYEFIMLNGLFKKELLNKQLLNLVIHDNINNLINLFEKDDKNKLILISYLMNECDFDNVKPYFVEFDHKDEYYLTMYKSEFLTDTPTPRFYSKKKQTFIKLINHILKSKQASEGLEGGEPVVADPKSSVAGVVSKLVEAKLAAEEEGSGAELVRGPVAEEEGSGAELVRGPVAELKGVGEKQGPVAEEEGVGEKQGPVAEEGSAAELVGVEKQGLVAEEVGVGEKQGPVAELVGVGEKQGPVAELVGAEPKTEGKEVKGAKGQEQVKEQAKTEADY